MNPQHTIGREVYFQGIGLHTGNLCKTVFQPAPAGSGVRLVRSDLPGQPSIQAHYSNVLSVIRGTTVGNEDMRVHTIEHMLSAVYALEIDNLVIQLNANEPPVADGSSQGFFDTLKEAGVVPQDAPRDVLQPAERLDYRGGDTEITLEPADYLELTTVVVYNHPLIQRQEATLRIDPQTYRQEIAPARTFCFDYEVEALKKQGLARGGSLDNAVVIGLDRIHNKEKKLRFPNEFARHKALDLLGDLFLLGRPLTGRITAVRCGHGHNINFVKQIAQRFLERSSVYAADRS
ncbi:MAG: UDP-3-O-[3-hydroxymyristoyl] N-acetylglucosamine deacetylase [Elusimicrobia bacterium RIFCSPLOWO2_01_FULL_59_12]|nr:MAG: UDP-3-O-[3-hydroxymyristoyl] N-acetylglucosamine deacetylase [Elusimicrobia bacterium RIFCSPLOWO2_01_FULL_59_12]